jgi:hypothetical protein
LTALRIFLPLENRIATRFFNAIRIKLPTKRRLGDFLGVPHQYVLPYLGTMESELIARARRSTIHTTRKGSKIPHRAHARGYKDEAEALLGPVMFE